MKTVTAGRFFVSTLLVSVILSIISPLVIIGVIAQEEVPVPSLKSEDSLQFTSDGHILSFSNEGYFIASTEGMLNTKFVNSNNVTPNSESINDEVMPLDLVTYKDLWDGVTVTYESAPGSILKSTYYVDTPEQVRNIRLSYNRPVELDTDGNLVIKYENGTITEEAPIAWQETTDGRAPVEVSYVLNEKGEMGFEISDYIPGIPVVIDPVLFWNTFLGGTGDDRPGDFSATIDNSGNIYMTGFSSVTWGSPIRPFASGNDTYVAKFNSSGSLLWNTFLGGTGNDIGKKIIIDNSGNIFILGSSNATWGSPLEVYHGLNEIFLVKLNSSGGLEWNTFIGGTGNDSGKGFDLYDSNFYISGYSSVSWGSPLRAYTGAFDAVVLKMDTNGNLIWNTFIGGAGDEFYDGFFMDNNGSIYLNGSSSATWGIPIHAYTGGADNSTVKLNNDGGIVWSTFWGGAGNDNGRGIDLDEDGNIYINGYAATTWGSPIRAYSSGVDGYVLKLNNDGALLWNTFLGGTGGDYCNYGLSVNTDGFIYASGYSNATWGFPLNPYILGNDAFIVKIDTNGNLIWNTFFGSTGADTTKGIVIKNDNIFINGQSDLTWGSPIRPYTSGNDPYLAKFDIGAPTTTDDISSSWFNSDVTVGLTCVDNTWGSGCLSTYYTTDGSTPTTGSSSGNSFVLSSQGVYAVKYFSVDNSTNTETVKTAVNTVNIDKTDPTGSISVDSGATYTNTTNVTLTLSATDDLSGLNQMKVSEDPLFTGVPWEAYNASKGFTLSGGDGIKTVYVIYQDLATNESIVYNDSITLDQTGPTGSITIDAGATYTNSLTTSLSHTADDGSGIGVNEMMISEDPAFAGAAWEVYNASSTFTVSAGDGVKTIYIKFRDTLNNEGLTYSDTITLDQAGPTGSVVINASDTYTHHTTATLTISGTDTTSSVDEMMVSESPTFIGGVWETYDASIWFDMSVGDGIKTIYIKFKDVVGNEGGTYSDTITLDQTDPTINITDLGLIDDVPDQGYLAYYFTSQTPFIQGTTEANSTVYYVYGSNTYTATADGTGHYGISIEAPSLPRTWVTLKYHAEDLAGNLSAERTLVLIVGIENFPEPEVTSTPSVTLSVTPSVTVSITQSTTITPTITEMPQTGDITPTPILPTIVIYKIEGGDGTLLVGAIVTIDGQQYVSDDKGQIYVQGRPDANPMVTIEYNGEVLSANISGSNITAGEAISQNTNLNYLFLILLMILLAGGGYWIYKRKIK